MCDPVTAIMIGSTAISTVGAIQQGQQQKAYNNFQADQANADAAAERGMGEVRAGKIRKAGIVAQGEATAGYAGAGIDTTVGSPLAVKEKLGRNVEEDALTELLTGQRRGRALDVNAQGYRAAGRNAETSSMFSAGASLLGGAAAYMNAGTARDRWIRYTNAENQRALRAGGMGTGMTGTSADPNW